MTSLAEKLYRTYCKAKGFVPAGWDQLVEADRAAWEAVANEADPRHREAVDVPTAGGEVSAP